MLPTWHRIHGQLESQSWTTLTAAAATLAVPLIVPGPGPLLVSGGLLILLGSHTCRLAWLRHEVAELIADQGDLTYTQNRTNQFMGQLSPEQFKLLRLPEDSKTSVASGSSGKSEHSGISEALDYDLEMISLEPHLALLGSSGTGKSQLLRYLLEVLLREESKVYLYPHDPPASRTPFPSGAALFQAANTRQIWRIGGGRDFGAIGAALTGLLELMHSRYENGGDSRAWQPLNVVVDEVPAIAASEAGEIWREVQQALIREARKVGIRLVIATQGYQVDQLGLRGASSLKASYTFIRLGEEAISSAIKLRKPGLVAALSADLEQSLADFKASPAYAAGVKFKGTAWLIGQRRLPYVNLAPLDLAEAVHSKEVTDLPEEDQERSAITEYSALLAKGITHSAAVQQLSRRYRYTYSKMNNLVKGASDAP